MTTIRGYAAMMDELQRLLSELQSSELDVDMALEKYERGQALIGELEAYLKKAENKIVQRGPKDKKLS